MNTEITESINGYVFYDGKCPICRRWIGWMHDPLARRGFHPVALQAPWAKQRLGLKEGEPLKEMKVLLRNSAIYGGAEALVQIARVIWWLWPLFVIAQIPGAKALLRNFYLRLAANRPCDDGVCAVPREPAKNHHHKTSSFFELP